MAYDLKRFIDDCRVTLKRDPGPAGRENVRVLLERLLRDEAFLAAHCSDRTPKGLHVLHDDSEPLMGGEGVPRRGHAVEPLPGSERICCHVYLAFESVR